MADTPNEGEFFGRNYQQQPSTTQDSPRFRTRIANFYWLHLHKRFGDAIASQIPLQLGVAVPWVSNFGASVSNFLQGADLRDVLDTITLIYRLIQKEELTPYRVYIPAGSGSRDWLDFVSSVLREEAVAYSIDGKGGVHPLVDAEFRRNHSSLITGLGAKRYQAVRHAFETVTRKLESTPCDYKGAVRDIFEALETLAKLVTGSSADLDSSLVQSALLPLANRIYGDLPAARQTGPRMMSSFAKWVDAAHPYRHGHKTESPVAPPEDLAILLISQGASYIRWLVDFDKQVHAV